MFAAEWGTGEVFLTMLYFFLFCIWIWLVIDIFSDIFRSADLSGWGKALWTMFVIFLPFVGIFTYLIVRGRKMAEHRMDAIRIQQDMVGAYVREQSAMASSGDTDALATLAHLRAQGVIDDAEYERLRTRAGERSVA